MWPPNGGAKSPEGDGPYAYPAGGYFSMKKSTPPPEAEKGNRGVDMGEKGGKLNKKACCISMLGDRVCRFVKHIGQRTLLERASGGAA